MPWRAMSSAGCATEAVFVAAEPDETEAFVDLLPVLPPFESPASSDFASAVVLVVVEDVEEDEAALVFDSRSRAIRQTSGSVCPTARQYSMPGPAKQQE